MVNFVLQFFPTAAAVVHFQVLLSLVTAITKHTIAHNNRPRDDVPSSSLVIDLRSRRGYRFLVKAISQ